MGRRYRVRFTTANIGRLILSLLIAFGIWAFVTNERDPDQTDVIESVTIEPSNLPSEFQIVESLPSAEVTLKGPRSVLQRIVASEISASVDMSGIDAPGDYELSVDVSAPDGLREIEVDPATVTVRVDTVVSATYNITIIEPANAPATLTAISVSPSQVNLIGVQQNVERVDRVELSIALSGRTESFSFTAQPIPYDVDGRAMLDTVRVEPENVRVSVEFEVRSLSVPVIVQCACPTDDGQIEIRDLPNGVAIPPTVRINGPEALIAQVDAVRTLPVSIDQMEESGFIQDGAELDDTKLPEGVTLERSSVGVYVEIEQQVQTFRDQPIEVINIPRGMRVEVEPERVTFEIRGPAEILSQLEQDPPMVVIDMARREEGTHVLAPRVALPPDVRVINFDPGEVQVTLEPIPPTSTPEPPPTPTQGPALTPNSPVLPAPRLPWPD